MTAVADEDFVEPEQVLAVVELRRDHGPVLQGDVAVRSRE